MRENKADFKIVRIACYASFFAFCLWLFYLEATEVLVSDIPTHISQALDESIETYSVLMILVAACYRVGSEFGVALLLAVIEIATLLVSELLMRRLLPDVKPSVVFACALCCNIAIAIYVPFVHPYLTRGLSCGNAWHNTTYLGMRLSALGAIWAYLRMCGYLESKRHALDWVVLTLCCLISTAIKPSFMMGFGPAIVILCVYDLIKEGKRALPRFAALLVSFAISAAVLAMQYFVLYVGDTSSGIEFGIARIWRFYHHCVPIGMLQSYLLPLLVLYGCLRLRCADRNYVFAWVFFIIVLLIYLLLNETGTRKLHANFGWGLKMGVYYLMISSVVAFFKIQKGSSTTRLSSLYVQTHAMRGSGDCECVVGEDRTLKPQSISSQADNVTSCRIVELPRAFEIAAIALFLLHTLSGVLSLASILVGNGYA